MTASSSTDRLVARGLPDGAMPRVAAMPRSAAAPSPFTLVAQYGFLSNCHTGALVAPDGTVDWLCVPRFDPPSMFCGHTGRRVLVDAKFAYGSGGLDAWTGLRRSVSSAP